MSNSNKFADRQRQIDELRKRINKLVDLATDRALEVAAGLQRDKQKLEAERMFSLIAHFCRLPCFFFAPLVCSFLIGVQWSVRWDMLLVGMARLQALYQEWKWIPKSRQRVSLMLSAQPLLS